MARQMVTRYGMSDVVGLMAVGRGDQEIFLGRELVQRREVSEHTAQQVDQEIKRVLDEAHQKARTIVKQHTDLLERVAQALLDRETLDSDDLGYLQAGEDLPPLPNGDEETEDGSAESEAGPADGDGLVADESEAELAASSVDEVDAQAEVPTAVELGDEPSVEEETSPGTARTPAVQLSAEDPEADASG